ncbi:Endosomal syntaxin B [Monocercomonoides exilis]|uniref:Endosomal syntaxin B n=1 Tax=Monocercomonoides exilis TaxID=2049356 RepID=UPI003559E0FE|nr:Endosomal syntaxin B [Monocercomonoides exilis]|eukprot:MONOS_12032.1-p1 / transcript=MONOS_12032.1 / gene=MONOS_12032 / organism=Monocercomonoides_exilis_PA203 / gene_product=unspecified product / transcript_product=unspecified product / location=Mono_scaffold00638:1324-2481(-) / protein_length=239 / sequence_SO=supercontig / SO=protein_coding / is_pseudo=false
MSSAYQKAGNSPLDQRLTTIQLRIKDLLNDIQNLNSKSPNIEEVKQSIMSRLRQYETELSRLRADVKGKGNLQMRFDQIQQSFSSAQKAYDNKIQILAKREAKGGMNTAIKYGMTQEEIAAQKAQQEQEAMMQQQANYQASILEDREKQFKEIHRDIVLVREATQDMNQMLNEQTEQLLLASDNSYKASQNVEAGVTELKKADKYDRKSRRKLCILLLIVVLVVVAVALIVFFTVRKK